VNTITRTRLVALTATCPRRHATTRTAGHDATGVPHTVWLAPPQAIRSPLTDTTTLPIWAAYRAVAEYAHPGARLLLATGPTGDPLQARPSALAPNWLHTAETVHLPDELDTTDAVDLALVLDDPPEYTDPAAHHSPGYYRTLRTALRPRGILLIHTHTRHTRTGLHDPASLILPAAQDAGFGYLQHLVLVHQHLDTPTSRRYKPPAQWPQPPRCRRIHSDLYVLTQRQTAGQTRAGVA
jgi:hypothetical protein